MLDHVQLAEHERLIWKSDTQGHDELIIALTPMNMGSCRCRSGRVVEDKEATVDQEAFCHRLDAFANKSIGLGNQNTTTEISEFLRGDD